MVTYLLPWPFVLVLSLTNNLLQLSLSLASSSYSLTVIEILLGMLTCNNSVYVVRYRLHTVYSKLLHSADHDITTRLPSSASHLHVSNSCNASQCHDCAATSRLTAPRRAAQHYKITPLHTHSKAVLTHTFLLGIGCRQHSYTSTSTSSVGCGIYHELQY